MPPRRCASDRGSRRAARSRCWRARRRCSGSGRNMFHSPASRARRLELLHHRRVVVRVAGLGALALVDLLGRVDVLVHERAQALLELGTALARLEVHRPPRWLQGLRIIPDERTRRQLPRGGRRLRGARRGKRSGDGQGPGDLAAARRPRRTSPGRLAWGARLRLRARRPDAGVRGRGARHEVDDRPRRCSRRRALNRFADVAYDTVAAIVNDLVLRGGAAAGRQRLLRHRLLGVVRRGRPLARRSSRAGAGAAPTPAACGGRGVPVASRACSPRPTSSSRGRPSARCPQGRRPLLGEELARGMRSCSWPPAACTPTAPRSPA